ncbi:DUF3105 domain-containing protein [uncultured Nocardioides sp.]|uniref:DUF3105 domain-containing protein n=1 Tax=uncultured Nocardioides sp. TaxID=198441 RepID=UPI0025EF0C94|nr:DUF3105 domain-containing protein [uncultured Nocardioides sp.]
MAKQDKTSRRAVIDDIRNKQKSAERRRGGMILGVAVLVGLLIIGAAAYRPVKDWMDLRSFESMDLADIGAPATDACQETETKKAEGTQDHVEPGTPLAFADSPPAFGQHYNVWESIDRKFYNASDRPELGNLVHNLEHGYTILWYDETAAGDEATMDELRGIASKFGGASNQRNKFKVAPWTSEDGDPFPDGQHLALTHWSAGGAGETDPAKQVGATQYCSEPSGEAVESFMLEYPYLDSPEPTVL